MVIKKLLIVCLLSASIGLRSVCNETIHDTDVNFHNLPDEIVQAFVNGDAKGVGKYFNLTVEIILSESQGVYGKAQAEQILKNFFTNNASANGKFNYRHLHNSGRDNVKYYIGELNTGKGLYRVTIYMKDQLIHLLRIESND